MPTTQDILKSIRGVRKETPVPLFDKPTPKTTKGILESIRNRTKGVSVEPIEEKPESITLGEFMRREGIEMPKKPKKPLARFELAKPEKPLESIIETITPSIEKGIKRLPTLKEIETGIKEVVEVTPKAIESSVVYGIPRAFWTGIKALTEGGPQKAITKHIGEKRYGKERWAEMMKKKEEIGLTETEQKIKDTFQKLITEPLNRDAENIIRYTTDKQKEIAATIFDEKPEISNFKEFVFVMESGGISLAEAIGVFVLTRSTTASAAFLSMMEATEEYNRAREPRIVDEKKHQELLKKLFNEEITRGEYLKLREELIETLSPQEAFEVANLSFWGTFALEKVGFEYMFSVSGPSRIFNAMKISGFETLQEETQTVYQNIVRKYGYDKGQKVFEGMIETAVGITIPSFAMGLFIPGISPKINNQAYIQNFKKHTHDQVNTHSPEAAKIIKKTNLSKAKSFDEAGKILKDALPSELLTSGIEEDINNLVESNKIVWAESVKAGLIKDISNKSGLTMEQSKKAAEQIIGIARQSSEDYKKEFAKREIPEAPKEKETEQILEKIRKVSPKIEEPGPGLEPTELGFPKEMPPFDSIKDQQIGPAYFKGVDEDTVYLRVDKRTGQPLTREFIDTDFVETIYLNRSEYEKAKTPQEFLALIKDKLGIKEVKPGIPKELEVFDKRVVALFIKRQGREAYESKEIGETLERIEQKAEAYDPVFLEKHPEIKEHDITVYHDPIAGEDLAVVDNTTNKIVEIFDKELKEVKPEVEPGIPKEYKVGDIVEAITVEGKKIKGKLVIEKAEPVRIGAKKYEVGAEQSFIVDEEGKKYPFGDLEGMVEKIIAKVEEKPEVKPKPQIATIETKTLLEQKTWLEKDLESKRAETDAAFEDRVEKELDTINVELEKRGAIKVPEDYEIKITPRKDGPKPDFVKSFTFKNITNLAGAKNEAEAKLIWKDFENFESDAVSPQEHFTVWFSQFKGVKKVEEGKLVTKPLSEKAKAIKNLEAEEKKLSDAYRAHKDKVENELGNIWSELEMAEAGERIPVRDETGELVSWLGKKSSFPDWIPEGLRSKDLFNTVMQRFSDIEDIRFPTANKFEQRELYNILLGELDSRLGLETEEIRESILESYDKIYKREVEEPIREGVKRREKVPAEEEIKIEDIFPEEPKGLKGATAGEFAKIPIGKGFKDSLTNIEMPEMVKMTEEIMGRTPFLKKYPVALGRFYGKPGDPSIGLHPDIFKEPDVAAKTLAHEIGHLIDFLPEHTIRKGRLISRLMVIKDIKKDLVGSEEVLKAREIILRKMNYRQRLVDKGEASSDHKIELKQLEQEFEEINKKLSFDNKTLQAEAKKLTQWWKPFNEAVVSPGYKAYRYSSPELYADWISVLFNKPEVLPEMTPQFYKTFFNYLDKKPEVKTKYFELMDFLNGSSDSILKAREVDINKMFEDGEMLFREKMEIAKQKNKSLWYQIKYNLYDKNIELLQRERALEKKQVKAGKEVNPENRISYLLEENNFLGNDAKGILDKFNPTRITYKDAGLTDEEFGKVIFLKRIIGDRSEIANPLGHDRNTAAKQLDFIKKRLGEEKFGILEASVDKLQEIYKKDVLTPAFESGLINPDTYKDIMKSENVYGTFSVLKYLLEGYVSPKIIHQVGTLEKIGNPLPATILKMIAFRRATHLNDTRREIINWLKENYPEDIEVAKVNFKTGMVRERPFKGILRTREKGVSKAHYVDPYIEKSMSINTTDFNRLVRKSVGLLNSKYFRPVFITFNVGFQSFNLMRDFFRSWKALPGANFFGLIKRYWNAIPSARKRISGVSDSMIKEMEDNYIIGLTYNDIIMGAGDDLQQTEVLLRRYRIEKDKTDISKWLKPITWTMTKIKDLGDIIETLPKVSSYSYLKEKEIYGPKETAHIIRSRVGTPDFTRKGAAAEVYNNLFLFSNIAKEGFRADYQTAFVDPNSRSGYWFKTVIKQVIPKLFMFLVSLGVFGDKYKELMDKATEYDKTNYFVIPVGQTEKGQTIYIRVPDDETGRFIGALIWKMLNALTNKDKMDLANSLTDVVSYTGGQLPSLTPALKLPIKWGELFMGKTPRDDFRSRDILTEDEMKAGGWYKMSPMLLWTLNNMGLLRVDVRDRVKDYTTFQKIVNFTPVINRWLKVSSYGVQEQLRKEKQKVERIEAIKRLEKREAIVKYTNEWLKSKEKDFDKIYSRLESAVYGGELVEKGKLTDLKKAFVQSIIKAGENPYINELIYAQTKDQQIVLIKKAIKDLSPERVNIIGKILINARIISVDTWNQGVKESREE